MNPPEYKPPQKGADPTRPALPPPVSESRSSRRQVYESALQKLRENLPSIPPPRSPAQEAGPRYVPPQKVHFPNAGTVGDSGRQSAPSNNNANLTLLAQIALLEQRVQELEDDFIEQRTPDGASGGLDVLGTKALYKVVALRAWRNGSIVAVGNESGNDTLEPTWDYLRMHP